jgi:uncharacterized cupin superfamily protein
MVALIASGLPAHAHSGYPEPFRARVLPREKRGLGDAFGLTSFGVNLTTLAPGKESAMRHWHSHEDELVYVLEGEVVLVRDAGEETLNAGMVVGFRAGVVNGHHRVNRSDRAAVYLEIGGRDSRDVARYPDVDLHREALPDGNDRFSRKDGTAY